mgnify:FL=1
MKRLFLALLLLAGPAIAAEPSQPSPALTAIHTMLHEAVIREENARSALEEARAALAMEKARADAAEKKLAGAGQ